MTFRSILADPDDPAPFEEPTGAPDFFADLNLDQVVNAITVIKQEYNLKPFFYAPLNSVPAIQYRQEIMGDLDSKTVLADINEFAQKMSLMRRYMALIETLHYSYHKKAWFLEAVDAYCDAVTGLVDALNRTMLTSRGLKAFRDYAAAYAKSEVFRSLVAEMKQLRAALATVAYAIIIKGDTVQVRRYEGENDYSQEVEATFQKFKQGAVKNYLVKLGTGSGMNHIEAKILNFVAQLFPEVFATLDDFCARHLHFVDETIRVFDREIQFYVAYLDFINPLRKSGLPFCFPTISERNKEVSNRDGFDIALAAKRTQQDSPIVCNDFYLTGPERVLIVSGPNQGGKTTFARTFGQLHYLSRLGCLVPGRESQLFLFDRLFTHFEREEDIKNLRGKLQDDLVRVHAILEQATPRSILVLNEIFSSTTLHDEVSLSQKLAERIVELDLLAVWVTFVDELASYSAQMVSMVSTIYPDNPAVRTYKIVRRPADGLAYAMSIAEKYHLTYENLHQRIPS